MAGMPSAVAGTLTNRLGLSICFTQSRASTTVASVSEARVGDTSTETYPSLPFVDRWTSAKDIAGTSYVRRHQSLDDLLCRGAGRPQFPQLVRVVVGPHNRAGEYRRIGGNACYRIFVYTTGRVPHCRASLLRSDPTRRQHRQPPAHGGWISSWIGG